MEERWSCMQVVEQLAGRASPPSYESTQTHREARHDLSAGIARECVDTHTLTALEQLLGAKGLQFLATFLRLAEAKQHAFAEMDPADCAVITAKTIRELATRIGWGYDTTEKYLVVLCALHFLYKEKSAEGSAYFFPLHRYIPQRATLDALEEVIGHYRPKVQSFARKAKRRFLVYLDQQKSPFLPLPMPFSRPFDLSGVEGDIERIMQEELGSGVIPQRLLGKIKGVLRYRCQATPIQKGDSDDGSTPKQAPARENGDFSSSTLPHESPFLQTGNSSAMMVLQNGRLSPKTGDSLSPHHETAFSEKSPFPGQSGDFSASTLTHESPLSKQKGNSPLVTSGSVSFEESPVLPQTGDSKQVPVLENGRLSEQTGDFSAKSLEVCTNAPYTYNVTYLISHITGNSVIRKKLAQFLARVLEKNEYENGYPTFSKYLAAFKVYTPDVIGRAFLATMFLLHHENWQTNPGATFTTQCKILSGHLPLAHYTLDDVEQWLQIWGHLSYPDLIVAVAAPLPEQQVAAPAPLITEPRKAVQSSSGYRNAAASTTKKKRTYGMHYTGDATILNKGTNNWGSPGPPSGKS
jgi:hypothetical protein